VTAAESGAMMAVMPLMPHDREWTVDDLDLLPDDDGLRYELLDGILLVSPAPKIVHQRVLMSLIRLVDPVIPDDVELLVAPTAYQPDRRTSLEPDLLVFRPEHASDEAVASLVLAVEILSPSSRRKDHVLKRSKYEDSGVEHYWIVDPEEPSVLALKLEGGQYTEVGRAVGEEALVLTEPVGVTLTPTALVRR
jgi:Uma2 family endonuclease